MRVDFFWPTLFKDVAQFVRSCHTYQIFIDKPRLLAQPLKPIVTTASFKQWGLDVIGEIHPYSSNRHQWILMTTNYFTKCVEAIPLREVMTRAITQFIKEHIFTRCELPRNLVTDTGFVLISLKMVKFYIKLSIEVSHSSNYYP